MTKDQTNKSPSIEAIKIEQSRENKCCGKRNKKMEDRIMLLNDDDNTSTITLTPYTKSLWIYKEINLCGDVLTQAQTKKLERKQPKRRQRKEDRKK